jgi:serine/threonine-protein kinase RsbT
VSKEDDFPQTLPLQTDEDVVRLRKAIREHMVTNAFGLTDQTKFITAASELARNTLRYGGGGIVVVELIDGMRRGLCLEFRDEGPGIEDIELALKEGYTSGGGMGLGLGGAKRLSDEFEINSAPGQGTTVKICKWKPY